MDQQPSSSPEAPAPSTGNPGNNVIYSSSPNGVVSGGANAGKGLSKSRLFAIAGAAAIVVLGTAGYVFGYYLPNKPENVYKSALTNTGKGYDELVAYLDNKELENKFKTTDVSGTFKLESDGFSTDGTFSAKGDEKNGTFSGDIGLGTTRLKIDGVAKDAENSDSPDVYLKFGGIKGLGANFGMPELDNLDDQWIGIDHSFLDTYLNQIEAASGVEATAPEMKTPKREDVTDAAKAVGEVSKKYLFTSNEETAVFKLKEYVKTETVDGKNTNHYKVTADKAHLKAFSKELGEKLDKTKLNDWAKETYSKNISELLDTEGMQKSVDDIKDGDTFDIWVNKDTKLVHKVRFTDTANANTYFDLGFNYSGGDEKPFFIKVVSDTDGNKMDVGLNFSINTKTNVYKAELDVKGEGDTAVAANIKAEIKPGTGTVKAEAPAGAITLSDALSQIGLGGYLELLQSNLQTSLEQQNSLEAELAPFSIEQ